MADQKFKSKVLLQGGVALPAESISKAMYIDANGELKSSATTSVELAYLSGVTSSVQVQLTDVFSNAADAQGDATAALDDAAAAQADATQALSDSSVAIADIDSHITETIGAHQASAISNVPAGSIAAIDVQAAINELDGDVGAVASDVADLVTLSGVAANSANLGTFTGTTIADSSTIKAALQSLETELEGIPSPFYYAGTWAASSNTPALANADTGVVGAVYYVSDAGSVNFGAGSISFAAGDRVANNGTTWDKWDMTDAVASVFGRAGAVTAANGDYTASQVTVVPAGNLASITVQAALEELQVSIDTFSVGSVGDIAETSFSIANNQAAAANVTGFAFSNSVVRSFKALVSVQVDATLDLWETVELIGINKAGVFDMAQSGIGDDTGVVLTITSGGQVQYTSATYSGFVSGAIKFRATTTTV